MTSTEKPPSGSLVRLDDRLEQAHVERERVGHAPVVAQRFLPRRLVVRADERQAADLHQLRRREEHHVVRIVQQRIDERGFLEHDVAKPALFGGNRRGEAGRTGTDDDDVEVSDMGQDAIGADYRGMYSTRRLLTIAIGLSGVSNAPRPVARHSSSRVPTMPTMATPAGISTRTACAWPGATIFGGAAAGRAGDPIEQVRDRSVLAADGRSLDHFAGRPDDGDDRGVPGERLRGIRARRRHGEAVVQIEHQDGGAGMRRNRHRHALARPSTQ